jgi:hypothetical protein
MIPLRWIFRSRWAALAWGAGICLSAVNFAGGQDGGSDAAKVPADHPAAANALTAGGSE